jgi:glutamine synthetase
MTTLLPRPDLDASATVADLIDRGVRYALASFVDAHGVSKAKSVPIEHAHDMLGGSELFTGAALDGVPQAVNDDEVSARPDLASATVLPWRPDTCWMASDLYLHDEPFAACSRGILRRVLDQAAELGFRVNVGVETEFYVLREGENGLEPASARDTLEKPCYDVRYLLDNQPWVDELVTAMRGLGWDVYSFDHEDGNGQFETDFAYADAMTTADRVVFFRLMAGEIARRHGLIATFMPKPFSNRTGSGAHINLSLADLDGVDNLFAEPDDPRAAGLSPLGYSFIAGVLRHAGAVSALVAPTVNSYKRLVAQGAMSGYTWAPIQVSYGRNNRTNMIRVPMGGGRIECRAADISMNPYLAMALVVATGLEGIREGLDPGEPCQEDMYRHTPAELAAKGMTMLPRTLSEAVDALETDSLAETVLGPLMHGAFCDLKRAEWHEYHSHVSDWEIRRYLKLF